MSFGAGADAGVLSALHQGYGHAIHHDNNKEERARVEVTQKDSAPHEQETATHGHTATRQTPASGFGSFQTAPRSLPRTNFFFGAAAAPMNAASEDRRTVVSHGAVPSERSSSSCEVDSDANWSRNSQVSPTQANAHYQYA